MYGNISTIGGVPLKADELPLVPRKGIHLAPWHARTNYAYCKVIKAARVPNKVDTFTPWS